MKFINQKFSFTSFQFIKKKLKKIVSICSICLLLFEIHDSFLPFIPFPFYPPLINRTNFIYFFREFVKILPQKKNEYKRQPKRRLTTTNEIRVLLTKIYVVVGRFRFIIFFCYVSLYFSSFSLSKHREKTTLVMTI